MGKQWRRFQGIAELMELEGLPGLDNTGHEHTSLGGAGERRGLLHDSSSDFPVLL